MSDMDEWLRWGEVIERGAMGEESERRKLEFDQVRMRHCDARD